MGRLSKFACVAVLIAGATPGLAQTATPQTSPQPAPTTSATTASAATTPATPNAENDNLTVTAKRKRHDVMRFLFGRNRRRGGFFANLFHPKKGWQTTAGHRQHCKRKFKSYDSRTNSYRGYSGVRHVCVL